MNIKLMKLLDELFGPLVCFFFHVYNSVKKLFVKPKLLPVNRILIIKFFGMGSIILTGPMIRALKDKFHNVKISILTFSVNREICELTNLFDEIITLETDSLHRFLIGIFKNISYLRKQKFDICFDLEFFSKFSTIICYLTGSRIRVGYFLIQIGILLKMMWRGNLLTHNVYYNQHKHTTDVFLALANAIGANTTELNYAKLYIPQKASESISRILEPVPKDKEKLIVVNINTSPLCLERRWPKEAFGEIVSRLLLDFVDVTIVLIGSKDDVDYTDSFIKILSKKTDTNRVINLVGKLSVAELVALIAKSQLLISNDSGPLHIAVSLNVPTVSFFGPETPRRFGPKEKMHLIFYNENIYCTPCLNVYNQKSALCNGDNICLKSVKPNEVYKLLVGKYAYIFKQNK